jgi:hypothetical protein
MRFKELIMKQRREFQDDFQAGLLTLDEYRKKTAELDAKRKVFAQKRQHDIEDPFA